MQLLFNRHSHTPATIRGELGTRIPGLGPQSRRSSASTPKLTLQVESEVIAHTRNACERGAVARAQWQLAFDSWAAANPQRKAPYDRVTARELRTMSPMASVGSGKNFDCECGADSVFDGELDTERGLRYFERELRAPR